MSQPPPSLRAVVFDFDGTIADTFDQAVRVTNALAEEHGFRTVAPEDIPAARQMSTAQFARFLGLRRRQIPRLLYQGKKLLALEMENLRVIHGIREVVAELKGRTELLGILTSNSVENVQTFLEINDLDCFDFIHAVPRLSGKSRRLRSILRAYRLSPGELAYIGDEMRDMKAARRARVQAIGVTWGFNAPEALLKMEPQAMATSAPELMEVLRQRLGTAELFES